MEALKNKGIKLSQAGSLFNFMMSHNEIPPVVGQGATILYWTDRHAYEVIEVDEKKKICVIQRYAPKRIDGLGMSDSQAYEYKDLTAEKITLYYKWGGWKYATKHVVFTEEFKNKYDKEFGPVLHKAYVEAGGTYGENSSFINKVIEGVTRETTQWNEVHIIFGVKREYYDYSF
jgi:hypothetical protein